MRGMQGSVENAGLGVGASVKGVLQVLHSDFVSNIGARGAAMGVGMQELLVSDTRFIGNKVGDSRWGRSERCINCVCQSSSNAAGAAGGLSGGVCMKHSVAALATTACCACLLHGGCLWHTEAGNV